MRAASLIVVVVAAACSEPSADRAERDLSVGKVETADYALEVAGGLAHVRAAGADKLTLRASCAELTLTLTRKSHALDALTLELTNVLPTLELAAAPGVLTADGSPLRGAAGDAPLTSVWRVQFPTGVDRVELATPPRIGDFTFLAFGDIQTGIRNFSDVVAKLNEHPDAEFILFLGDLTDTTEEAEFDQVDAAFAQVVMPVFATPGNHDVTENLRYQRRYGRASYSCTHHGARFTAIDSSAGALPDATWSRYDGWLEQGRGQLHVVFSHIPVTEVLGVRSGQWSSRTEAHRFTAGSVEAGVDLALFGHIHSFDAYELGGIPTYISGGGGAIPERFDGIDRHFLKVHVRSGVPDVEVVRVDP